MSTAEFNQTLTDGADVRAFDVVLAAGDEGPEPFEHNLPFTPTFIEITPRSSIGSVFPGIGVTCTATTCTLVKQSAANTGGTYTLYLGRWPNPQTER